MSVPNWVEDAKRQMEGNEPPNDAWSEILNTAREQIKEVPAKAEQTRRQKLIEKTQLLVRNITGQEEDYKEEELLAVLLFICNSYAVYVSSIGGVPDSFCSITSPRLKAAMDKFPEYYGASWATSDNISTVNVQMFAESLQLFGSDIMSWFVNEANCLSVDAYLKRRRDDWKVPNLPVRVKAHPDYSGNWAKKTGGYIHPDSSRYIRKAGYSDDYVLVVFDKKISVGYNYADDDLGDLTARCQFLPLQYVLKETKVMKLVEA
jgi:hypothetical protein